MAANDNARQDFSPRPYQISLIDGAWADLQAGRPERMDFGKKAS